MMEGEEPEEVVRDMGGEVGGGQIVFAGNRGGMKKERCSSEEMKRLLQDFKVSAKEMKKKKSPSPVQTELTPRTTNCTGPKVWAARSDHHDTNGLGESTRSSTN